MKTIIAEKPSVAREIARIVEATEREEGYFTGNGYNVTWAFGHLVQPALPEGYGIRGFHPENLPIIPQVFTLVPRQVKTDKGYKTDADRFCHKSIVNLWQNRRSTRHRKGTARIQKAENERIWIISRGPQDGRN